MLGSPISRQLNYPGIILFGEDQKITPYFNAFLSSMLLPPGETDKSLGLVAAKFWALSVCQKVESGTIQEVPKWIEEDIAMPLEDLSNAWLHIVPFALAALTPSFCLQMGIGEVGATSKRNKGNALIALTSQQLINSLSAKTPLQHVIIRALGRIPNENQNHGLLKGSAE